MNSLALARPTAAQLAWHQMEIEMFVHFGPATWQEQDNDDLSLPPAKFNPTKLDTEQWCDVAESFGARQIILVAKHVGGFCLWQTDSSTYGLKQAAWRNGKGDIAADLAASCQKRGLRLGMYLSPADKFLDAGIGGRCATPEAQDRYTATYRQQLTELLTRYGPISEIWFDGSLVFEVSDIVTRYAPDAIQFQGPQASIRWAGNEEGILPYPAWNTLSTRDARSGIATVAHSNPDGDAWLPLEVDTTLRGLHWGDKKDPQSICWFWKTYNKSGLKSLDRLIETYYRSVGHGAVLLLNSNPDTTGRIPREDVRRVAEFGNVIRERFSTPLAETSGRGKTIELAFPKPRRVDHVTTTEDITFGHRVRRYVIEGLISRKWKRLASGTAIGYKKIDFFPAQKVAAIRFRAVESVAPPLINRLAAFHVGEIPTFDPNPPYIANPMELGTYGNKVTEEGTTITFDVSSPCGAARQYDLELIPAPGSATVTVDSVQFIHDGADAPQFVTGTSNPLLWSITVTGVGGTKSLSLRLRRTGQGEPKGTIVLRGR